MLYNRLSSSIGRALLLIFFLNMSVGCNRIGHFTDPLAMEKNIDQAPKTSFTTGAQSPIENEEVEVEPNLTWRDHLHNFCGNLWTKNTVRYVSGFLFLAHTMVSIYSIGQAIELERSSQSPDLFKCDNLELLTILMEGLGLRIFCKLCYWFCQREDDTTFKLQYMNIVYHLIEFGPIARMWNPVNDRLAQQDITMTTFCQQMKDFVSKDDLAWSIVCSTSILQLIDGVLELNVLVPRPQHQD